MSPLPSSSLLPHATRPTPPEPLVELFDLLASTEKKRLVLTCLSSSDKLFLFTSLLRHHRLVGDADKKAVLALANEEQKVLWKRFLATMTTLKVVAKEIAQENEEESSEEEKEECNDEKSVVHVVSHEELISSFASLSVGARLLIVDNCHLLLGSEQVIKAFSCQVIMVVSSLIEPQSNLQIEQRGLKKTFSELRIKFDAQADSTCHLLSSLTHAVKPTVHLIVYEESRDQESLLDCDKCLSFLDDHNFSLIDICGPDLEELVKAIPDPTIKPKQLLLSLIRVHKELGPWCTKRAAMLLLVILERMSRREKYERHFLLLGAVATQVERVFYSITYGANESCQESKGESEPTKGDKEKVEDGEKSFIQKYCNDVTKHSITEDGIENSIKEDDTLTTSINRPKMTPSDTINQESLGAEEHLRMLRSTHHKLLRLVEVLRSFKPLHVGRRNESHQSSLKQRHLDALMDDSNKPPWLISYDDPDALYGMVCVDDAFKAQVIFHFIKELSRNDEAFSFLSPQYYTDEEEEEDDKKKRRKMEEALRKFRVKESNLLITNASLTTGLDQTRCNLIVAFDPPRNFSNYIHQKVRARGYSPLLVHFVSNKDKDRVMHQLSSFKVLEDCLRQHCSLEEHEEKEPECDSLLPVINVKDKMNITSSQAIFVLNRYCSKLPSDAFTRLVAKYDSASVKNNEITRYNPGEKELFCTTIRLPISSPVRKPIVGPLMPTRLLSRQCAALKALFTLNEMDELDHVAHSIRESKFISRRERIRSKAGKEDKSTTGEKTTHAKAKQLKEKEVKTSVDKKEDLKLEEERSDQGKEDKDQTVNTSTGPTECEAIAAAATTTASSGKATPASTEPVPTPNEAVTSALTKASSNNATKRRPYYFKQVSPFLTTTKPISESDTDTKEEEDVKFFLYSISMRLNCPLPEEQNTRGRRLHDPELSEKNFGLLVSRQLPSIPSFPIYTRSGEVMVHFKLIKSLSTMESLQSLQTFHNYTFGDVLRLSKFPMIFCPEKSDNSALIVPLDQTRTAIDVDFVHYIVTQKALGLKKPETTENFVFKSEDFEDAVVLPWYRNLDQPQFYYVAEICPHLTPEADFPGQGFESFEKYYRAKYDVKISNLSQPLLDVDHTSQRLNFLTPRHVNRKGIALPTSSEETKRMKRENLDQKQILVPELCIIHPFPASLWRQAVTLPCIFYRLNSLLVAEGLRRSVAKEMGLGKIDLEPNFEWDPLDFGWSLGDVVIAKSEQNNKMNRKQLPTMKLEEESKIEVEEGSDLNKLSHELINKMNEEDKRLKQKSLEIGMWSNDMSESIDDKTQEDFDLDDEDLDPNVALPDNLILLGNIEKGGKSNNNVSNRRDWGTGIAQKKFRVGSPTFFKNNPHINIPGAMSDDDDDDNSYVDDTSTDDEDNDDAMSVASLRGESVSRIRFNNDNEAEAVDERDQQIKCDEWINQTRINEASMVEALPWNDNEEPKEEEPNRIWDETFEADVEETKQRLHLTTVVADVGDDFDRYRQSEQCDTSRKSEDNKLSQEHLRERVQTLAQKQNFTSHSQLKGDIAGIIETEEVKVQSKDQEFNSSSKESSFAEEENKSKSLFSFDYQPDLSVHTGPSPSLLLQALTMSNSNDAVNLERLETIGDSFLKYATTTFLFCENANISEGQLSDMRSKIVSNFNLHRCGRRRLLGECMVASKFEPHDNWLPPCFYVPKAFEQALIESEVPASHLNTADLPPIDELSREQLYELVRHKKELMTSKKAGGNTSSNTPSFVPYNLLTQHKISEKSIADCVEALIGAYLLSCGPRGAMIFMCYMGLQVLPKCPKTGQPGFLKPPPTPSLTLPASLDAELTRFERQLGYNFNNKALLLQALCHASFSGVRLTDCYQRLEFLGDAVLDYLITRHAFEDPRRHSPGELTDLRSALVNNNIFATLAAWNDFHVYYNHCSPTLDNVVHRFVELVKRHYSEKAGNAEDSEEKSKRLSPLVSGMSNDEVEEVEGPKWLADVFESVAGAVFVDSNLSLDAVWSVYEPIMREDIEAFSKNVPKSAVRELLELEPETATFGKPQKMTDGKKVRVKVTLMGKGEFTGIGRNYRLAKCSAAKCALRAISKNKAKR